VGRRAATIETHGVPKPPEQNLHTPRGVVLGVLGLGLGGFGLFILCLGKVWRFWDPVGFNSGHASPNS
jgi:hypothetical protein